MCSLSTSLAVSLATLCWSNETIFNEKCTPTMRSHYVFDSLTINRSIVECIGFVFNSWNCKFNSQIRNWPLAWWLNPCLSMHLITNLSHICEPIDQIFFDNLSSELRFEETEESFSLLKHTPYCLHIAQMNHPHVWIALLFQWKEEL